MIWFFIFACETCHEKDAREWKLSGHASAGSSWIFRLALTHEPEPEWCVGCHSPTRESITCVTCHKTQHTGRVDKQMCVGCHEFGFLRLGKHTTSEEKQQATVSEWRASGSEKSCLACHPAHTFGGVHREERLRRAVTVVFADGAFTVTPIGVGHRWPTGDVMRWVSLEVADDPLFEDALTVATFGKTLVMKGDHLSVAEDTTLAGPTRVLYARAFAYYRLVYHLGRDPELPSIVLLAGAP